MEGVGRGVAAQSPGPLLETHQAALASAEPPCALPCCLEALLRTAVDCEVRIGPVGFATRCAQVLQQPQQRLRIVTGTLELSQCCLVGRRRGGTGRRFMCRVCAVSGAQRDLVPLRPVTRGSDRHQPRRRFAEHRLCIDVGAMQHVFECEQQQCRELGLVIEREQQAAGHCHLAARKCPRARSRFVQHHESPVQRWPFTEACERRANATHVGCEFRIQAPAAAGALASYREQRLAEPGLLLGIRSNCLWGIAVVLLQRTARSKDAEDEQNGELTDDSCVCHRD